MNKQRRADLDTIAADIADARSRLEEILSDEQDYLDNMPEGIREGERGERAEEAISRIEDAVGELENVEQSLSDAVEA